MKESFELIRTFKNVNPSDIYDAWIDSAKHTAMTGGEAICSTIVGERFTAWDEYISGKNLGFTPNKEIIQSWRTTEFNSEEEDSHLIVRFKQVEEGTELTLIHSNLPQEQTQYKNGWKEHYFTPMESYFEEIQGNLTNK